MSARLNVAIATAGRFHVLDLARELAALGHDVRFYSYVPRRRAERFGLPRECHRGLLPFVFPILLLQRVGPKRCHSPLGRLMHRVLNRAVRFRLEPCEVFICMSGMYLEAAVNARERLGALIYLERGSRHIDSQKEILDSLKAPGLSVNTVDEWTVLRERAGYRFADRIVVPSLHAERSFCEKGVGPDRLFRNPYGVDLSMFPPTMAPVGSKPTLLYVGVWSFQKGVDVLVNAWKTLSRQMRLLHVGSSTDAPMPLREGFEHHDPVPQWELTRFYEEAHVFVLPSRHDGFGLVLSQALACGVPVVCTDRTGGEDLKRLLPDQAWIKVVPSGNAAALAQGIQEILPGALALKGERDLLGGSREQLSWAAYGRRYAQELVGTCEDRFSRRGSEDQRVLVGNGSRRAARVQSR
jgi:starch synthase